MARLTSTGRKPALDIEGVEKLLEAYHTEDTPSVTELAERFDCTKATVRKYLKLALGSLPRGRAALKPRKARNVKHLVNQIPTEALIGRGSTELMRRRHESGESKKALAEAFGLSKDRVRRALAHAEGDSTPAKGDEAEASPDA